MKHDLEDVSPLHLHSYRLQICLAALPNSADPSSASGQTRSRVSSLGTKSNPQENAVRGQAAIIGCSEKDGLLLYCRDFIKNKQTPRAISADIHKYIRMAGNAGGGPVGS